MPRPVVYTDDELRRVLAEYVRDGSGTRKDYDAWAAERGGPTSQTIRARLGSWHEAIAEAGGNMPETRRYGRRWSTDEVARALSDFCSLPGRVTLERYRGWARKHGRPSAATVLRRWGRWSVALGYMGRLAVNSGRYSFAELRAAVEEWATETDGGREQNYEEWAREHKRPSPETIRRHMKMPVSEYVRKLGCAPKRRRRYTRREMIVALQECARDLSCGTTLGSAEYYAWARGRDVPCRSTIADNIGWLTALDYAGLEPKRMNSCSEYRQRKPRRKQ